MSNGNNYLEIKQSPELSGDVSLYGAKNAVLVIMASFLLTSGKSHLKNVPGSSDVLHMIKLLESLGAVVVFDQLAHELEVDTSSVSKWHVRQDIMKQMRASILVMGPLLARFSRADIALPGGCVIGSRPIDLHLKNFEKMGVEIDRSGSFLKTHASRLRARDIILDYPSVGATENLMMAAVCASGITRIVNAALEPEVLDLISVLRKMGAKIDLEVPATICVEGVDVLEPVEHALVPDRLEAGTLLLAAAITGGSIAITNAKVDHLAVFLLKLEEMGHQVSSGPGGKGIQFKATQSPQAVSFKTAPYPGFPTDLQAPMMAVQCLAQGRSVIDETVFENRLVHIRELQKMGAQISVEGSKAIVTGVEELYGANVIASDIRASCALAIAGLAAKGTTTMTGISHWRRGYDQLEKKMASIGASIKLIDSSIFAQQPLDQLNISIKNS
jgi:UDP-N-acetylglucosamine 1-carboxyvinyltransferase